MLRRNINTADGFVNGARGILIGFVWNDGQPPYDDQKAWPKCVLVDFFDDRVGRATKAEFGNGNSVPIDPLCAEFYGNAGSILARTQFPPYVVLGLQQSTKVQGLTLNHVVLDVGTDVFSS